MKALESYEIRKDMRHKELRKKGSKEGVISRTHLTRPSLEENAESLAER